MNPPKNFAPYSAEDFDIQRELNQLEEIVLDSPRIPLIRRTIVDEDQLLDQLDLIRITLPEAFEKALQVLNQQEEILKRTEEYCSNMIATAEQRAAQILDELGIVRQAEIEANQIRQQVIAECENIRNQTLAEIENMRRTVQQETEQIRRMTLAECEDIQNGADQYADSMLRHIESQLSDMLRIVQNGRQELHKDMINTPPEPPVNSNASADVNSNANSNKRQLPPKSARQRPARRDR